MLIPVGITEVLESHSQPLSNEELYNLAQQLTEEDEDEKDRGPKKCRRRTVLIFFPLSIWQLKSYVIPTLTGNALEVENIFQTGVEIMNTFSYLLAYFTFFKK